MEEIIFTATQFGRYMEFTDRVDLDQIDPQIAHYTKELMAHIRKNERLYCQQRQQCLLRP